MNLIQRSGAKKDSLNLIHEVTIQYKSNQVEEVMDLVDMYKKEGYSLIDFDIAYENKKGFYKLKSN